MSTAGTLRITTPSEREVVMERVFAAPRVLVFDALTRPELFPSRDVRETVLASGPQRGAGEVYDRLAEFLASPG